MTKKLTVFNFKDNQVRTNIFDGEPWFCLPDVCIVLDVKQCRIERLSEKGVIKNQLLSNGGSQETYFINEPNLYRLIFRSNKPQAQEFADWVYSEVLPTIRKTGSYISSNTPTIPVNGHMRRLPSTKKEIVLSDKARSEIGGIVKRCCSVAIREAFSGLAKTESIKIAPPIGIKEDKDLITVAESIVSYGEKQYRIGKIQGILTGMFDDKYQTIAQDMNK